LPRFLDDGAAAKLLQATRAHPDPFTRLAVEFLARTGLRKGEFCDLTIDSVVQIGSAYWLHVPIGKLRTDRYIPLHPQLKDLLDDWIAHRPTGLREPYLFIERGRRITTARVDRALANVARQAGIGHVTPHQLRHTLATQAKVRGVESNASFSIRAKRGGARELAFRQVRLGLSGRRGDTLVSCGDGYILTFRCVWCNDVSPAEFGWEWGRDVAAGAALRVGGVGEAGVGVWRGAVASGSGGVRGNAGWVASSAAQPAAGRGHGGLAGADRASVRRVHQRVPLAVDSV
jgi:hypothetical protein